MKKSCFLQRPFALDTIPLFVVFSMNLCPWHTPILTKNIYKTANINTKLTHPILVMWFYVVMPPDNCSDINWEETKGSPSKTT